MLVLSGCKNDDTYSFDPRPFLPKYDSFYKENDITRYTAGKKPQSLRYLKYILRRDSLANEFCNKAGFDCLDSGYYDMEIRIGFGGGLRAQEQYFILKRSDGTWNACINIVSMDLEYIYSPDSSYKTKLVVAENKKNEVFPKSNWETVFRKLNEWQIFTLPDGEVIDNGGSDAATDGEGYSIEVATSNMNRRYSYSYPEDKLDKWQAKSFYDIMNFLYKEFGFTKLGYNWGKRGQKLVH
ncbi:MAG: hypothetical protein ABIX01_11560 [Chitinophagaceae bacterium]